MDDSDPLAGLLAQAVDVQRSLKAVWSIFAAAQVFFIHISFIYLKSGAQGSGDVISGIFQTLMLMAIGILMWALVGYGIAFGTGPVIGLSGENYAWGYNDTQQPVPFFMSCMYMTVSLGIVSNSLIARVSWPSHAAIMLAQSALVFPFMAHWFWSPSGWLHIGSPNAVGSGVADHGNCIACVLFSSSFAMGFLASLHTDGRRQQPSFESPCHRNSVAVHNRFYLGSGLLLFWYGWYAVVSHGLADLSMHDVIPHSMVFLTVCGGTSVLSSLLLSYEFLGYIDLDVTVFTTIGGLVSCAGSSYYVDIAFAPLFGVLACSAAYLARHLRISRDFDDGLCVSVSFFAPSLLSTLLTPIMANEKLVRLNHPRMANFNRAELFGTHLLAAVCVMAYAGVCCAALLFLLSRTTGLMASCRPLDLEYHGELYCHYLGAHDHGGVLGRSVVGKQNGNPRRRCVRLAAGAAILAVLTTGSALHTTDPTPLRQVVQYSSANDTIDQEAVLQDVRQHIKDESSEVDTIWMLVCATKVFLMQIGFCFLEAGSVRSGNVINIIFMNAVDFAVGLGCWWAVGYALAFSEGNVFIGWKDNFFLSPDASNSDNVPHFYLMYVYMTTAVTIISGAAAERINLQTYLLCVVLVTALAYPMLCRWFWFSESWLGPTSPNRLGTGALDFAGGLVIHAFGGCSALVLSALLGPRVLPNGISVFSKEGEALVSPHNKFQQAIGMVALWFAWCYFNSGSAVSITGDGTVVVPLTIIVTCISTSASIVTAVVIVQYRHGSVSIVETLNCGLTGLVGITPGCAYMPPSVSPFVGFVSPFVYFGVQHLRKRLKIDDVVDAGAVHLGGGLWGCLCVGLFCSQSYMEKALGVPVTDYGLLMGGGWLQLVMQCLAAVVTCVWGAIWMALVYYIAKLTFGPRVKPEQEIVGLDWSLHRAHSYDYIRRAEEDKELAVAAVNLAAQVAESLIMFDLEKANSALRIDFHDCCYVVEMKEALGELLDDLASYRPYLPDSLFVEEVPQGGDTSPPGSDGQVAIAFTDIQGSTTIWESFPSSMRDALRLHNKIIRQCIIDTGGYEVKTIGDAFMVAFASMLDATAFALLVQQRLFDADTWPADIEDLPQCSRSELWRGLRVRIGVNYGDAGAVVNPVTGRYDYTGTTVNMAARLEAASQGGAVCVTDDWFAAIAGALQERMPHINVPLNGAVLKGVPGTHHLQLLLPAALAQRKQEVESGKAGKGSLNPRTGGGGRSRRSIVSTCTKASAHLMSTQLQHSTGTLAQVSISLSFSNAESIAVFNRFASDALLCVDRCDGSVVSLIGWTLLVGWNAGKPCTAHLLSAVRFVRFLYTLMCHLECPTHCGLVTGPLTFGGVGSLDLRFVNVFGPCVEWASTLSSAAGELQTFCAISAVPGYPNGGSDEALRGLTRPVDTWTGCAVCNVDSFSLSPKDAGVDNTTSLVYEVNTRDFEDSEDAEPLWEWSDAYPAAFESGDYATIEKNSMPDNPVTAAVVHLLKTGTHLSNRM